MAARQPLSSRHRRHTHTGLNVSTNNVLVKPTPPETSPRLLHDITNGWLRGDASVASAAGDLAEKTAEVARLSSKTLELMSTVQVTGLRSKRHLPRMHNALL